MPLVTFFFVAMTSAIFPPINGEFAAMWLGSHEGWPVLVVGVTGAAAQTVVYVCMYFFGARLAARWHRFHELLERTKARHGARMRAEFIGIGALAGVVGLPPAGPLAALAPGLGVRLPLVLGVLFPCRIIRFSVCAAFGEQLVKWWNG